MQVDVSLGDLEITKVIEVAAFSVLGVVQHRETHKSIQDVQITTKDKAHCRAPLSSIPLSAKQSLFAAWMSRADGSFILHDVGDGAVDLDFSKEGMVFESLTGLRVDHTTSVVLYSIPVVFCCSSLLFSMRFPLFLHQHTPFVDRSLEKRMKNHRHTPLASHDSLEYFHWLQ